MQKHVKTTHSYHKLKFLVLNFFFAISADMCGKCFRCTAAVATTLVALKAVGLANVDERKGDEKREITKL